MQASQDFHSISASYLVRAWTGFGILLAAGSGARLSGRRIVRTACDRVVPVVAGMARIRW